MLVMGTARRNSKPLVILFFSILVSFAFLQFASAVDYNTEIKEKEAEIAAKKAELESSKDREYTYEQYGLSTAETVKALAADLEKIASDIKDFQDELKDVEEMVEDKSSELEDKEGDVGGISISLYKMSRASLVELVFSSNGISDMVTKIGVKRHGLGAAIENLRQTQEELAVVAATYNDLSEYLVDLDQEIERLDSERQKLEDAKAWYEMMVALENKKQNTLLSDISKLTAQQQALIAARSGGSNVNLDSVPSTGDPYASLAGFRSYAPGGSFGVFSIGAYTHRNGMSQWGARARADAGQTYTQILKAYYPSATLRTGTVKVSGVVENITSTISISGYGTKGFEDYYLLGIKEMPESWPMEVLKAQAIAARTFAIRYTANGRNTICTTESCQVFSTPLKTEAWVQAVQATEGMILVNSDATAVSTQYAAVHGGWVNNVGWDTTDKSGAGDWMKRAWDSISGVSWFYKSWYRETYSDSSSSCGRYPWLSQEEMSDLINLYLVINEIDLKKIPDTSRFLPITLSTCPISGVTGNPYSLAEMRGLLNAPVTSVSYATVSLSSGSTGAVTFGTNKGAITMTGYEFKQIYSIRSPGYLRIPQSGFQHFNIEKN
ncbi:MAG: SpoIID/LytB domain-containing protein [bacterium]